MAKSTRKISRRKFLQSSVAAGAVLSLPAVPWLSGCGDGSDDDSQIERRRLRLHFDLSHAQQHDGPFVLHAIGTASNKVHLTRHTAATRAQFKHGSRRLGALRDDQLTHFAQGVDLPRNRVQQVWVTAGTSAASPIVMSKIFCGDVDVGDPDSWTSARDYAIALIFHHPEIARLDTDQAAIVCAHINSTNLELLEEIILENDAFDPIPVTDLEGAPMLDDKGEQLVQFDPSDELLMAADDVVKEVLARIFDDPELEGANWHRGEGQTSLVVPGTHDLLTAEEGPQFDADFPADRANRSSAHGMYFTDLKLLDGRPGQRTLQLDVKNSHFRWVGVWADFVDQNGKGVESTEKPNLGGIFERDIFNIRDQNDRLVRSRYMTVVGPTTDFLGIPVRVADSSATPIRFVLPDGASQARMRFLTLGLGGSGFKQPGSETKYAFNLPIYLTSVVNIGIPAYLIATGVGEPATVKSLYDIVTEKSFLLALAQLGTTDLFNLLETHDARKFLLAFGTKFVAVALKTLPTLAEWIITTMSLQGALQAVPIVGWAVKMVSLTAATAKLAQAVTEVLTNPPLFENKISVLLTTKVSIRHDPRNSAGFPATATKWEMQATYNGRVGQTIKGDLNGTQTEPIERQFRTNSGGFGKIEVWFLTDNNWIAGYGTTGTFLNIADGGVLERPITITENLVPITAQTQYHHREILVHDSSNDRYAWQAARDLPPTLTASSLVCDDNSLCELNGITLSENAAVAGYSWRARSRTLALCGGGTTTSPVQRIQNVSFTQRPNDGLKRSLCGYTGKPLLAYELYAKPGDPARYFYLDPTGGGDGYHLRQVALDTAPFDQSSQLSWGQFAQPQNSIAIHPAGYVVGISTQTHTLEIIQLPEAAMPDAIVTSSVLKAGRGTRIGLLDTPFAIGIDQLRKAIYVLEAGNARVQAFDVNGNPMKRFMNGTSEERPLLVESNATYLDMAVESTGWIYILSFAGNGRNASDYRLDIYDPDEKKATYTSRTTGVAAAKLAVSLWRNVYTLNYEPLVGPNGLEPTLSQWIPSTPDGCDQQNNPFCQKL